MVMSFSGDMDSLLAVRATDFRNAAGLAVNTLMKIEVVKSDVQHLELYAGDFSGGGTKGRCYIMGDIDKVPLGMLLIVETHHPCVLMDSWDKFQEAIADVMELD